MTQKHVLVILLLIVMGGLIASAVGKIQQDSQVIGVTPTPTQTLNFNASNNSNQSQTSQQSTQRKTYPKFPGTYPPDQLKNKVVLLDTTRGQIVFALDPEATKAASNFIFLSLDGFYNGLTFHRVEPGFVVQGGDPLGNGTGGPGYQFEDEPVTKPYTKGTVAMANSGPNTNGSQFFIMIRDHLDLPPKYTIFGHIIKGQEIVDQIKAGDIIKQVSIKSLTQ